MPSGCWTWKYGFVFHLSEQQVHLGAAIVHRWPLLIDMAIIVIFGILNIGAWLTLPSNADLGEATEAATRLREATVGVLAATGFLLPLTVVAVQLGGGGTSPTVPHGALVDFFVATVWLAASLLCGLIVLALNALKGFHESILKKKYIGIIFDFQLIFLFVAVLRLVWGFAGLVSAQL